MRFCSKFHKVSLKFQLRFHLKLQNIKCTCPDEYLMLRKYISITPPNYQTTHSYWSIYYTRTRSINRQGNTAGVNIRYIISLTRALILTRLGYWELFTHSIEADNWTEISIKCWRVSYAPRIYAKFVELVCTTGVLTIFNKGLNEPKVAKKRGLLPILNDISWNFHAAGWTEKTEITWYLQLLKVS